MHVRGRPHGRRGSSSRACCPTLRTLWRPTTVAPRHVEGAKWKGASNTSYPVGAIRAPASGSAATRPEGPSAVGHPVEDCAARRGHVEPPISEVHVDLELRVRAERAEDPGEVRPSPRVLALRRPSQRTAARTRPEPLRSALTAASCPGDALQRSRRRGSRSARRGRGHPGGKPALPQRAGRGGVRPVGGVRRRGASAAEAANGLDACTRDVATLA